MDGQFTGDMVRAAYAKAPAPMQDAFSSDATGAVLAELRAQYGLEGESAATLGREVAYMLVGLTNPSQFVPRLIQGGIPSTTAESIATAINEKIFASLKDSMRELAATVQTEPSVVPPPTPAKPLVPPPSLVPPQAPAPSYVPPPVPPAPPTPPPPPAPVAPSPASPTEEASEPWKPEVRTMAHDVEAIKTGTMPTPQQPAPVVQPPAPPQPVPTPTQQVPRVPDPWSAPVTPPPINSIPAVTHTPVPNPEELKQGLKKYGIDPYREQID